MRRIGENQRLGPQLWWQLIVLTGGSSGGTSLYSATTECRKRLLLDADFMPMVGGHKLVAVSDISPVNTTTVGRLRLAAICCGLEVANILFSNTYYPLVPVGTM